ncbi:uncharacterized protein PV09_09217 [Verruconis gallopava]|uniref:ER-bound oxygenase mpaB/mpaB'/Rubber oxygenase catalytic domain-containing protein n=1 Tax=Verruconis gallopava TaxID=253628 RepID=A0A0D1ZX84_9PEZI|nr:uncharacterized protein PV09_09217 [Verruconis gallopava]KIV99042.1 hypothetical protein PV09_09217 [Verruconis gallopava]
MVHVGNEQNDRNSESERSKETDYSLSQGVDLEKGLAFTSTGDAIYEPAAPIEEIKPIISEFIGYMAGLTTVLLQVAHPVVGRGVGIHSEFSVPNRAKDRADKTGIYVYVMVFGEPYEKAAMRDYVNKMHGRVKGGQGKTAYYAKDPEGGDQQHHWSAQLWVAATMYADIIRNYEKVYGPIEPPEKAERIYREFSYLGTSLNMPPELWPKDRAAFWAYYNDMIENKLEVTPEAEKVCYDLMHPWKATPWYMKPVFFMLMPTLKALTVESFPPKIRDQYGLKSTRMTRFRNAMVLKSLFAVYPHLPESIRHHGKNKYMKMMKKMMAKQGIQEFQYPKKR